jgi:hypothetical protein
MPRRSSILAIAVLTVATMPLAQLVGGGVAGAADYTTGTPSLATITNGSTAAPWNEAQGDPLGTPYPQSDLLPTFRTGGPTAGSPAEPNVAVYPGAGSGSAGVAPYPSGWSARRGRWTATAAPATPRRNRAGRRCASRPGPPCLWPRPTSPISSATPTAA